MPPPSPGPKPTPSPDPTPPPLPDPMPPPDPGPFDGSAELRQRVAVLRHIHVRKPDVRRRDDARLHRELRVHIANHRHRRSELPQRDLRKTALRGRQRRPIAAATAARHRVAGTCRLRLIGCQIRIQQRYEMGHLLLHRSVGGGGKQQQYSRGLQRHRHHPRFLLRAVLIPDAAYQNRLGRDVQRRKRRKSVANAAPQRAIPRRVERHRQQHALQMIRGRNHRPAQLRHAILRARAIAPASDRSPEMRERCGELRYFALARRTILGVLAFFKTGVTDEVHGNSLLGQMFAHCFPSSLARTAWSARKRCALTVPSFIPVISAISRRSISSTNRSRNTVRCRAGRLAAAVQIACTCS